METKKQTTIIKRQASVAKVSDILLSAAGQWDAIYDTQLIQKDMLASLKAWMEDCTIGTREIYGERYFAIREGGTEYGTRQEVEQRCKDLGRPVQIIKVIGNGSERAEVRIKFTI